MDQGGVQPN